MNLGLIFLTGLTTGGVSCAALQGGLLASIISNQKKQQLLPAIAGFLGAKLIAYTLLGIVLGAVGASMAPNQMVLVSFQVIAALYVIASGLHMLDVHPIFRYVVITPPKKWFAYVRQSSKTQQWFAPIVLGALMVLIPCGVTQAMEINAISSGSGILGGLVMFSFILGTMPLFVIIGVLAKKMTGEWQRRLATATAVLLILLGLNSINGSLIAIDAPLSTQKLINAYRQLQQYEGTASPVKITTQNNVQTVNLSINTNGYSPEYFQVKRGVPVKLVISTGTTYSCANFFTFRAFNISLRLQSNDTQTVTFTPTKIGQYTFSCAMGMYTGTMEVVN